MVTLKNIVMVFVFPWLNHFLFRVFHGKSLAKKRDEAPGHEEHDTSSMNVWASLG